ncbi:uncharacterized protein LOC127241621 [Andrographis paniculata]|uniref:uncharacterized protein LOC127241621 n=1 Tax=Andrographis paniculata TaxID=175694 RepID=UPI0021E9ACD0|nr:uncharacterized protein LOC127241621 [Andrographis paniculata]
MQQPTFHQQAVRGQPLIPNQQEAKPLMDVDVIANCIRRTFSKRRAETPEAVEAPVEKESAGADAPLEKEPKEAEVPEAMEAPELVETETPKAMEALVKKESAEAEVPEAMEAPEFVEVETSKVVEAPAEKESAEAEVPEAMEAPKFAEVETPGTMETPNEKEDVRAEAPYEKDSAGTQAPKTMKAPYEKETAGEETPEAMKVPYEKEPTRVKALVTSDEKDFAEAEALATKLANGKTYLCPALKPTKGFIPFANTMSAKGLMKDKLSIQPSKPSVQDCL